MTTQEGIEYLADCFKFRAEWEAVIRQACGSNSIGTTNTSVTGRSSGDHRSRKVSAKVGVAGEAEDVFRFLLTHGQYSAPFSQHLAYRKVYTGKIDMLIFGNPIVRLVDNDNLTIFNVTLPKHILFPGYVEVQVKSRANGTWVDVTGSGKGNWAWANTVGGPIIFENLISRIESARRSEMACTKVAPQVRWIR